MIVQRLAGAFCLACLAAYFAERPALADLAGVPMDLIAAGMMAFVVTMLARPWRGSTGAGGVHG